MSIILLIRKERKCRLSWKNVVITVPLKKVNLPLSNGCLESQHAEQEKNLNMHVLVRLANSLLISFCFGDMFV